MPPYLTVSTYVPCPDEALPGLLARYADLLSRLGYQGRDVRAWLAEIAWPPHGEDEGAALHPDAPLAALKVSGQPMLVLSVVTLWTPATIPTLEGQWLSLELAFDTHTPDDVSQSLDPTLPRRRSGGTPGERRRSLLVARRKSLPLAMTRAAQPATIEGTSDETGGSRPY
jgi:hypothetical protein